MAAGAEFAERFHIEIFQFCDRFVTKIIICLVPAKIVVPGKYCWLFANFQISKQRRQNKLRRNFVVWMELMKRHSPIVTDYNFTSILIIANTSVINMMCRFVAVHTHIYRSTTKCNERTMCTVDSFLYTFLFLFYFWFIRILSASPCHQILYESGVISFPFYWFWIIIWIEFRIGNTVYGLMRCVAEQIKAICCAAASQNLCLFNNKIIIVLSVAVNWIFSFFVYQIRFYESIRTVQHFLSTALFLLFCLSFYTLFQWRGCLFKIYIREHMLMLVVFCILLLLHM